MQDGFFLTLFLYYINNSNAPQPPAAPPVPMAGPMANGNAGGVPPPPPPPPMGLNANGGMDMSSLAAQLQQTKNKLKGSAKNNPPPPPAENSGSSTSSGGSGNYGTIGRTSTGMATTQIKSRQDVAMIQVTEE